jgi:hypothetical protein
MWPVNYSGGVGHGRGGCCTSSHRQGMLKCDLFPSEPLTPAEERTRAVRSNVMRLQGQCRYTNHTSSPRHRLQGGGRERELARHHEAGSPSPTTAACAAARVQGFRRGRSATRGELPLRFEKEEQWLRRVKHRFPGNEVTNEATRQAKKVAKAAALQRGSCREQAGAPGLRQTLRRR